MFLLWFVQWKWNEMLAFKPILCPLRLTWLLNPINKMIGWKTLMPVQGARSHDLVVGARTRYHWTKEVPLLFLQITLLSIMQSLTHLPLVSHICVNELSHRWLRKWLVACSAPSHSLNQCGRIVNWSLGNIFQWNLNPNYIIFIQEDAIENIVCQNGGHLTRGD